MDGAGAAVGLLFLECMVEERRGIAEGESILFGFELADGGAREVGEGVALGDGPLAKGVDQTIVDMAFDDAGELEDHGAVILVGVCGEASPEVLGTL